MDIRILEELGLTKGEIKVYLALLKISPTSTGLLAKESQVSRSKLYIILDKLEKKGLASHIEKENITYFSASEPSRIKVYLKEKEDKLKELQLDFENFLPELEKIYTSRANNEVKVYQGLKGLITAHEHIYLKVKKGESYYYFGIPSYQPESHHLYWQRDHLRRIEAGIHCKLLFNRDTSLEILKNRNSYDLCEARYMPKKVKTPAYFLVYNDVVVIVVPSENSITIEITSKETAESFRAYFDEFWKKSKKIK